jgi:ATP-dependent Clp protease adapter protein ClpS
MHVSLTHESPRAVRYATGLFLDWLAELPDGPLKAYVAALSQEFSTLPPEQVRLFVVWDESDPVGMSGTLRIDDRVEVIGPYVHKRHRRNGFAAWMLETSCRMAMSVRDVYLLSPAAAYWAIDALSERGFEPVESYIRGATGDHRAFHTNQIQRAARHLARAGEPRGRGPWAVNLQNDPTTTFDFVVSALARLLDLNDELAIAYAMQVHQEGFAPIRYCRSERSARKLADRIVKLAKKSEFPLQVTVQRR